MSKHKNEVKRHLVFKLHLDREYNEGLRYHIDEIIKGLDLKESEYSLNITEGKLPDNDVYNHDFYNKNKSVDFNTGLRIKSREDFT